MSWRTDNEYGYLSVKFNDDLLISRFNKLKDYYGELCFKISVETKGGTKTLILNVLGV
jgi:hypothetical protein